MRDRGHGKRLRRTPDTFRGTEDPAGVSGHLRGLAQNHGAGRLALSRESEICPPTFGSIPARPRPLDLESIRSGRVCEDLPLRLEVSPQFDHRGVVLSSDIFLQLRQVHAVGISELLRVINDEGHQRLPQV